MRTLLLLALVLLGCSDPVAERAAELRLALEVSDASLVTATLPTAEAPPELDDRLARVWVGDEVRLDLAPVGRALLDEPIDLSPIAGVPLAPIPIARVEAARLVLPGTLDSTGHTIGLSVGSGLGWTPLRRGDLQSIVLVAGPERSAAAIAALLSVLAHVGTQRVSVAVQTPGGRGAIALAARTWEPEAAPARHDDVGIEIREVEGGLSVEADGGVLASSCTSLASGTSGPTLPHHDGAPDLAGLERCVGAVVGQALGVREIFVVAGDRPFGDVVQWLAAIDRGRALQSVDVVLTLRSILRPPPSLADVLAGGAVTGSVADVFAPGS